MMENHRRRPRRTVIAPLSTCILRGGLIDFEQPKRHHACRGTHRNWIEDSNRRSDSLAQGKRDLHSLTNFRRKPYSPSSKPTRGGVR
jgi:hypothetical protein